MRLSSAFGCVLALVFVGGVTRNAAAEIPITGNLEDDIITLVYDPTDGNLRIDNPWFEGFEGEAKPVTTIEIVSENGYFTGTRWASCGCYPIEVFRSDKIFIMDTLGLNDFEFGPVLTPGLSLESLGEDLTVRGSLLGGGSLNADLMIVPEPNLCFASLLLCTFLGLRRRCPFRESRLDS